MNTATRWRSTPSASDRRRDSRDPLSTSPRPALLLLELPTRCASRFDTVSVTAGAHSARGPPAYRADPSGCGRNLNRADSEPQSSWLGVQVWTIGRQTVGSVRSGAGDGVAAGAIVVVAVATGPDAAAGAVVVGGLVVEPGGCLGRVVVGVAGDVGRAVAAAAAGISRTGEVTVADAPVRLMSGGASKATGGLRRWRLPSTPLTMSGPRTVTPCSAAPIDATGTS